MSKEDDRPYFEVINATKLFGGLKAVNDLTFSLHKGEVISIIGPNGAGKTTLLNLISGIFPITRGEILYKGQKIGRLPAHEICFLGISRSFQNQQLFDNLTVLENVMVGSYRSSRSTLPEVMFRVGRIRREEKEAFDRAMDKLCFLGLEKKAYEMPSSLALKERQFLGIARALAAEPEMLLLDEPVGGLTVEEINETSGKILKMREQGLTILFIEHRMELVNSISDRVIVMDFGQKIAEGTFQEMQRDEKVIAAYLGKREA